ncbi:PSD1 and planctomycete cytochrome C domain-containing protein [Calycomorphotria hydatis]|uniref:Planctomycete cytochrome C n=1 Tax=Calycomorphotria hydatis TaxID=2528027 RepID=A0A517T3R5_9PLAN|nr:PSD1 and planctomycete cytochrome C domain-containing protein [Calycomorphotria hydatis]QDT63015.1 Planctomycete cytochrome C [Calycomorphotria hydatis]
MLRAAWTRSALFLLIGIALSATARADEMVSFRQRVQPILSSNCFACHGPDEETREADLRLDIRQEAIDYGAIVPGEPDESSLVERIFEEDPDLVMPPPASNHTLTAEEKQIFRDWVSQGAEYEAHWAFVKPDDPELPDVSQSDWPRNGIDQFILHKLEQAGLSTSLEADPYTLVRRVYLDLTGLPPTPEEADAFVNSDDPKAYEKLVDQLLASPRYGERWARLWLDLARYADSNGYEKDRERSIWPYRDWVINALNADMPYDQFTIEQLAGDMLPNPSPDQLIATGFHRNTMLNEEGGIDPQEFRYYAVVDRVATTGTVWLGLTTGCAQCHTHKYDPITHTDYYRLMALLNNADEPEYRVPDEAIIARQQEAEQQIAQQVDELAKQFPPVEGEGPEEERRKQNLEQKYGEWLSQVEQEAVPWNVIEPTELSTNLPRLEVLEDGSIFSTGDITKRDLFRLKFDLSGITEPITAFRMEAISDHRLPSGGPGRTFYADAAGQHGRFYLSEVDVFVDGEQRKISDSSVNAGSPYRKKKDPKNKDEPNIPIVADGDGSSIWYGKGAGEESRLVLNLAEPIEPGNDSLEITMLSERHFACSLGRFRWSYTTATGEVAVSNLPVSLQPVLLKDVANRTAEENDQLKRIYLNQTPELAEARKELDQLRRRKPKLPVTLVMEERPADNPRVTHRHHRGEYLSTREVVGPGIPAMFVSPTDSASLHQPANRLELAKWLVSDDNPLAARAAVNRAWRAFFGKGIVATSGDFGTQSEPPSHPELLDWLASQFKENGWSFKKLHRLIVTSSTYRQSSQATPELLAKDNENRLLARGPRFRVDAEMVRDIMLKSSGLLSTKMGGPGVRPPQPESVSQAGYGKRKWVVSKGEDKYRRSIYTFMRRTTPFAAYQVFDAPTGETCTARRDRSNTPLQALTLLNDAMYMEMAKALAPQGEDIVNQSTNDLATSIFRRVLTRQPTEIEVTKLGEFYESQLDRLNNGELTATEVSGEESATNERAAAIMLARAVMNLDEAITKE